MGGILLYSYIFPTGLHIAGFGITGGVFSAAKFWYGKRGFFLVFWKRSAFGIGGFVGVLCGETD